MSVLYRLVYASKNLLTGDEAEVAAAVLQILETSQRNNVKVGVTGALLFNKGAFAQVLEGERRAVEDTFERIQRDMRHGDVTVLQCGPAEGRGFTNWSMAFVGHSTRGQAMWNGLAAQSGFDLSRLDGDDVFNMLHGLVLEEEGISGSAPALSPREIPVESAAAASHAPLDVGQVRAELAQLHATISPTVSAAAPAVPAAASVAPAAEQTGALAVLKSALADERRRTTDLRNEIDELKVALAMAEERVRTAQDAHIMWSERARLLALAIGNEADAVCKEHEPSMAVRHANRAAA